MRPDARVSGIAARAAFGCRPTDASIPNLDQSWCTQRRAAPVLGALPLRNTFPLNGYVETSRWWFVEGGLEVLALRSPTRARSPAVSHGLLRASTSCPSEVARDNTPTAADALSRGTRLDMSSRTRSLPRRRAAIAAGLQWVPVGKPFLVSDDVKDRVLQFCDEATDARACLTSKAWAQMGPPFILPGLECSCISCFAFSPDNRTLVVAAGYDDLKCYDAVTGELRPRQRRPPHIDIGINAMAFSADGGRLFVGGEEGEVALYDVASYVWLWADTRDGETVHAVGVSPDNSTLAVGGGRRVRLLDALTGSLLREIVVGSPRVISLAIAPDGAAIAVGVSSRGGIYLYATQTGGLLRAFLHLTCGRVAFSPCGRTILVGGSHSKPPALFDVASGELQCNSFRNSGYVKTVAFSPDGAKLLLVGSLMSTRDITIFNAATGVEIMKIERRNGGFSDAVFSPDGRAIAACSYGRDQPTLHQRSERRITFYNPTTGDRLRKRLRRTRGRYARADSDDSDGDFDAALAGPPRGGRRSARLAQPPSSAV